MSSTRTIWTRQNSKVEEWDQTSLNVVLSNNRKARGEARRSKAAQATRGREPAIFLGEVAWHGLFPTGEIEIPDTVFMDQLENELTKTQVESLRKDIKEALAGKKEEFCRSDYISSLDARAQLTKLVTKVMMEEAGFVIDELLDDCKKQHTALKVEKDQLTQLSNNITSRKRENNQLKQQLEAAIQEFIAILQETVEKLSEEEGKLEQ